MPTYLEALLSEALANVSGTPAGDPCCCLDAGTRHCQHCQARDALALVEPMTCRLALNDRVRIVPNDTRRFRSLSDRQGVVTGMTHYGYTVRFPGDPSRYRTSIPRGYLQRLPATAATLQAVQP